MKLNYRTSGSPKAKGIVSETSLPKPIETATSFDFSKKERRFNSKKTPNGQKSLKAGFKEAKSGAHTMQNRLSENKSNNQPDSFRENVERKSATRRNAGKTDEFEQSYSRIKKFIHRLSSSGNSSKHSVLSTKRKTDRTFEDLKMGSLYGVDTSPANIDNIRPDARTGLTPGGSNTSNQQVASLTDVSQSSPVERARIRQIEAKLAFVLSKLNLRNCDSLSKESLENIKVAIEAEQSIQREENQVMFVSLERENQSLKNRVTELAESCEKERRLHRETLQKMEQRVMKLNEQISDLQKIIAEQERTIIECNSKLKTNRLGEVSPRSVQDLVRGPYSTSKSIFEDFDGIFKSLVNDIKAKEKLITDLEQSQVFAVKNQIKSDFSQLVEINTGLKSLNEHSETSGLTEVQHLQEQMRNIVVKHGKEMKNMEKQFQEEVKAIKSIHKDEREMLEIKLKALEKELSGPKDPTHSSLSGEFQDLNRRYKESMAEVNSLKAKVSSMEKEKNRARSNGEPSALQDMITIGSNSKQKTSLNVSGLPEPILAESANAFSNIAEESPTTLKIMAEGLMIREGNLVAKEKEIAVKEEEINYKIGQIEEYTKHAEEQINQKVNEINEAEINFEEKKKKLRKKEEELRAREIALQGHVNLYNGEKNDQDQSTEARNSNNESNNHHQKGNQKNEKNGSEFNNKVFDHMKEEMHSMSFKVVDLEKLLLAERMEKEKDRYLAAQMRREFERVKTLNHALTEQIVKLGESPVQAEELGLTKEGLNQTLEKHSHGSSSYYDYYIAKNGEFSIPNDEGDFTASWASNSSPLQSHMQKDNEYNHHLNSRFMEPSPSPDSISDRQVTTGKAKGPENNSAFRLNASPCIRTDQRSNCVVYQHPNGINSQYSVKVNGPNPVCQEIQPTISHPGQAFHSPTVYGVQPLFSNDSLQSRPLGNVATTGNTQPTDQQKLWDSIKESSTSATKNQTQE